MASFEYVESAIVFGIDNKTNLRSFKYTGKDFVKHGDAFKFTVEYFDDYGEFPPSELLCENFPTLNKEAQSLDFEYATEQFKDQVLQRKVIGAVNSQKDLVRENPKKALSNIMVNLTDIEVVYDEDVEQYDSGNLNRLDEWRERTKRRKMGDGLMGIPTSFNTLNSTGVGWMPGELVAMYARPTVGKTWMCVHAAATAIKKGFKTLLISTEMPLTAINMRMDVVLASMMGYKLSHTALRRGDDINEEEFSNFLKEIDNKSLLVCDHIAGQVGISIDAIASLIRKHAPEFVVIDGVYLISTKDSSKKQAWEQSHSLFYGLKNLATSTNTPIMVSTQATKDASDMYVPPRTDQVAFGDALLRAADVAISMCAVENEPNKRRIQFQKYRDGQIDRDMTIMNWEVNSGNIKELPDTDWGEF